MNISDSFQTSIIIDSSTAPQDLSYLNDWSKSAFYSQLQQQVIFPSTESNIIIALASISFTYLPLHITPAVTTITCTSSEKITFNCTTSYHCKTITDFVNQLNLARPPSAVDLVSFSIVNYRVVLSVSNCSVEVSSYIAAVCAFSRSNFATTTTSKHAPDLNAGFRNLYVCCSLCAESFVGIATLPLLSILHVGTFDGHVAVMFPHPHYFALKFTNFANMRINFVNSFFPTGVPLAESKSPIIGHLILRHDYLSLG